MKGCMIFALMNAIALVGMETPSITRLKNGDENKSVYDAQTFTLTRSSSEQYAEKSCKRAKQKKPRFKILCKKYMYYQLIGSDLRLVTAPELSKYYNRLDLSNRDMTCMKQFLKEAVYAFKLSTGKSPKEKELEPFNLHQIVLKNNRLKSLPHEFKELAQCVQTVDLSRNYFEAFPAELEFCTNLKSLNVTKNQIKEWPAWIDSSRMMIVEITGNKGLDYPKNFKIEKRHGSMIIFPQEQDSE